MPRKKLTKTQIKRKFKTAYNAYYDLIQDKLGHPDSHITMSLNKMLETLKGMSGILKRMK